MLRFSEKLVDVESYGANTLRCWCKFFNVNFLACVIMNFSKSCLIISFMSWLISLSETFSF